MANDGRSPQPAAPKLRVSFEQSGGFAGLLKGCVLDADELPADESAELRRLWRELLGVRAQRGSRSCGKGWRLIGHARSSLQKAPHTAQKAQQAPNPRPRGRLSRPLWAWG